MISYQLKTSDVLKVARDLIPDHADMLALGFLLVQQVKARFASRGRSGGILWPEKASKSWGYDDGRAVLTGRTNVLLDSFKTRIEKTTITLYSDAPYAHVHQLGTQGKGGVLPTIRPRQAKALFIPITDRAKQSQRFSGSHAVFIRKTYGMDKDTGPVRLAMTGTKVKRLSGLTSQLRQGRVKDGRLEVRDADGDWVRGVPDFIFLKKVDIPPRPMLPTSPNEQREQTDFIMAFKKKYG